ncbi:MAG: DUF3579 domain-containing protein [Nitrosomonas sp.]|nr:DUF3579 domain-containing protein [Nitrosomonas sp.]
MATIQSQTLINLEALYLEHYPNNNPEENVHEWLILGITADGRTFRPTDWAERLCGAIAEYNNGRLIYSDLAYPITRNGQIGIVVETLLRSENPAIYSFFMNFARDNRLKIISGREAHRSANPSAAQIKAPLRLVV